MKKINYWEDAETRARQELVNKSIDDTEAEVIKQYKKVSQKIIEELTNLYNELNQLGDNVKISDLYSYRRYYQSLVSIEKRLDKLGQKEDKILTSKLEKLYVDVSKEISDEYNFNFPIDEEAVNKAITSIWVDDGKRFSDRIYTHKKQMLNKLEETLVDGIQTGKSTEKLAKEFNNVCKIGMNESRRLIRTELAHCEVQAAIDSYKKIGVNKYRWLTANGCCDECGERNGKEFSIDSGIYPPEHPNCRCTVLAVIDLSTMKEV